MLLRRVSQHVKDQNWFAVVLDFSIVVIGVFIGIQVSNWNDARNEASQEQVILASIVDDLRSDELQLNDGIRMAENNIRAANYTLEQAGLRPIGNIEFASSSIDFSSGRLYIPQIQGEFEQTNRLWSQAVVRYHPTQSSAAFDTLMATGDLGLIKDRELVQQLQTYQLLWNDIEGSQNTTFRPFRNQAIFVGQKFGLSPFTDMPEQEFVELVSKQSELEGTLRTIAEYSVIHRDLLEQTRKLNQELMARVSQDIEL
ncbi:MAG: DUF6090 family protein [Pseudomonadota bacterium]